MVPSHVPRARLPPPHPGGDRGLQQRNTSLLTPVCRTAPEGWSLRLPGGWNRTPTPRKQDREEEAKSLKREGSRSLRQTRWAFPGPARPTTKGA